MGDTPTGKLVATVAPLLIMAIATFMILNQLQIAPAIVTITYAVLLGSLGLGMALAFGLGGRETAAQLVSGAYDKGQGRRTRSSATWRPASSAARTRPSRPGPRSTATPPGSAPVGPQHLVPRPRALGSGRAHARA